MTQTTQELVEYINVQLYAGCELDAQYLIPIRARLLAAESAIKAIRFFDEQLQKAWDARGIRITAQMSESISDYRLAMHNWNEAIK